MAHMRTGRILVAPITISPTKPLTPTHVNYLLTIDVLCRATGAITDVTLVYDHQAFASGQQTVAFWEYLDRVWPGVDFGDVSEQWIGELYIRRHAEPAAVPAASLRPYIERVRTERWMHPSARRILEIWRSHSRMLGLLPPLADGGMPATLTDAELTDAELIELLVSKDLCIDGRAMAAPVYLDLTAHGMPLRPLVNADGQGNYLICVLRQLLPVAGEYDLIVLMYDRDMRHDYMLVERVLRAFGAEVARVEVSRVAIGGVAVSSRHGGWQGFSLPELRFAAGGDDLAFRLGLRLYLVAVFGRGGGSSFTLEQLPRWVARAQRLLDPPHPTGPAPHPTGPAPHPTGPAPHPTGPGMLGFLGDLAKWSGYVDPYRLTSRLLSKDPGVPVRALVDNVYAPSPSSARTALIPAMMASAAASVQ
jgi:hypothetical protein